MTTRLAKRILLLGWDAADWKVITPLLEAGKMPYLERLINEGVMGNIATLSPILSPMLWTSIATGKRADKHGILGFLEPRPDGSGVRPVSSTSRQCAALWNMLSHRGMKCSVVGWFAGHPAEPINGVCVSNIVQQAQGENFENWPLPDDVVQPATYRELIRDLRVHPSEISAEHIVSMVPRAGEVDQDNDARLGTVAKLLADFQTTHNIGTYLAEYEEWDLLCVYYDSIDHFGHAFMHYRPPRMVDVTEEDAAIYGDVTDNVYRLHDLMLARYMELVGDDTTILLVSDHGFHSDHLRPPVGSAIEGEGFTNWHRDYGIFLARGPGIKKDERIYGATLLDVAPTVLTLLGLPVAEDMDGEVLTPLFEEPPAVKRIDSYDPAWKEGRGEPTASDDPWAAQAAVQQLAALGYVEAPGENAEKAIRQATAQKFSNLATVYLSKGEHAKAVEALEEMGKYEVFEPAKLRLAYCRMRMGQHEEAHRLLEEILEEKPNAPYGNLMKGYLLYLDGNDEESLVYLRKAEESEADLPRLQFYLGLVYLRQKHRTYAKAAFLKALQSDPESARAFHGLGICLYQENAFEEAVEKLMKSVALDHNQPNAHFNLGLALAACGQRDWAIRALETCSQLARGRRRPHELLARLYRSKGEQAKASLHLDLAGQLAEQQFEDVYKGE